MELYGHALAFAYSLRKYCSLEDVQELMLKNVYKLCLTDAIRYAVRPEETCSDVVKFGRGYSHFTDGCGMKLPIREELRSFSNIGQTKYVHKSGYVSKFADEPTDFGLFFALNPHLFEAENLIWGLAIISHLQQDVASDITYQHNLCVCDTNAGTVTYPASGRVVDGKQFREDMGLANIWMHRYMRLKFEAEYGDKISQDWINQYVCESYYLGYPEGMARNSCGYLNMDERVFDDTDERIVEIVQTLVERGLIRNEEQLLKETEELFSSAIGSCATLVNHLIRL